MLLKIWQSPRRLLAPHRERGAERERETGRERERRKREHHSDTATYFQKQQLPKEVRYMRWVWVAPFTCTLNSTLHLCLSLSICVPLSLSLSLYAVAGSAHWKYFALSVMSCSKFRHSPKCMLQFCLTKRTCGTGGRCLVAHGILHASSQV